MRIITTRKVNCKDCHRCLRSCPVKAIGIIQGRARVLEDKCILCGRCLIECPQHAKQLMSQVEEIKLAIKNGRKVIMSLASSFSGVFSDYTPSELVTSIKLLGFSEVEETAVGGSVLSQLYRSLLNSTQKTVISSNCPVIVNIIRKYYPDLVENLAPIVSPMVAHAKLLKAKYGQDTFVVFAGPCVAKFAEREEKPDVDAVITYVQLRQWLKSIKLDDNIDEFTPASLSNSRYFPIAGGLLKSFMNHDEIDNEIVAVDGIEKCIEVFDCLSKREISPRFIEAFSCVGGCVGGPASGSMLSMPARRAKVIEFAKNSKGNKNVIHTIPAGIDFKCSYSKTPVTNPMPTEAEIQDILRQTGKFSRADEKNCGACGYNTCREKAIAVFRGVAEIDMCMPYMRSKAESFADIIVKNSLNAIVAVDEKMIIQELNPTVKSMFGVYKTIDKGSDLSDFIDCTDFILAARLGKKIIGKRVEYPEYGVVTEQMIIPVKQHGLIIAVISDVTEQEKTAREWQKMKHETVEKATEIINKQMQVAQEIAGLLGETTAETKSALLELMWLLKGEEDK